MFLEQKKDYAHEYLAPCIDKVQRRGLFGRLVANPPAFVNKESTLLVCVGVLCACVSVLLYSTCDCVTCELFGCGRIGLRLSVSVLFQEVHRPPNLAKTLSRSLLKAACTTLDAIVHVVHRAANISSKWFRVG